MVSTLDEPHGPEERHPTPQAGDACESDCLAELSHTAANFEGAAWGLGFREPFSKKRSVSGFRV